VQSLHTSEEVGRAEKFLSEKLLSGEFEENDTCLTRWNKDKKQVEIVLGNGSRRPPFREVCLADPDIVDRS